MDAIAEAVRAGRCVLFAGSGVSRDAGLPDWLGLGKRLREDLAQRGQLPPALSTALDSLLTTADLVPAAIDLILSKVPRREVARVLRQVLVPSSGSPTATAIKEVGFRGAATTNYDRVLDPAFPHQAYRLTNSPEKLKLVPTAVGSKTPFLLKVHGDIDDELDPADQLVANGAPFMVLSKADFAALVQGERGRVLMLALHSILQECSLLFLGYSFSDPDISWMLRFLGEQCQFAHSSWYVVRRGENVPSVPANVSIIEPFSSWNDLPGWLTELSRAARKRAPVVAPPGTPAIRRPSPAEQQAFLAIGKYLSDLETDDIAERVLSSVLLDEIAQRKEFPLEWLSIRVGDLLEVGPTFAATLATGTVRSLIRLGLVERTTEGNYHIVEPATETLQRRATGEWERDRSRFYASIETRLSPLDLPIPAEFTRVMDATLVALCIRFGRAMAEWVHRGLGRELSWSRAKDILAEHSQDPETVRKAEAVFGLIFGRPSDDEVPYLYRLLAAAFLANSVRLDPSAASALRAAVSAYELYFDTNVLLPLVVEEHVDHEAIAAVVRESRDAGVRLVVLQGIFNELCAHRDIATRIVAECRGMVERLEELVDTFGLRANVFIQGYVRARRRKQDAESVGEGTDDAWRSYIGRYSDGAIERLLAGYGMVVVVCNERQREGSGYGEVLRAIGQEWEKKLGYRRPEVLNETEAEQFCHVYHRRRDVGSQGDWAQVWFLSHETVLAKVFEKDPTRWGLPPTFPFSAWTAFLDSRLPWTPKKPASVVSAIVRGHSGAFDLPDPVAVVRSKAFGDRVTTADEEAALTLAMSGFDLVTRVERARRSMLSRNDLVAATRQSSEATKAAVAEISTALTEQITRLRGRLQEQSASLKEVQEELDRVKDSASRGGGVDTTRKRRPRRRR